MKAGQDQGKDFVGHQAAVQVKQRTTVKSKKKGKDTARSNIERKSKHHVKATRQKQTFSKTAVKSKGEKRHKIKLGNEDNTMPIDKKRKKANDNIEQNKRNLSKTKRQRQNLVETNIKKMGKKKQSNSKAKKRKQSKNESSFKDKGKAHNKTKKQINPDAAESINNNNDQVDGKIEHKEQRHGKVQQQSPNPGMLISIGEPVVVRLHGALYGNGEHYAVVVNHIKTSTRQQYKVK